MEKGMIVGKLIKLLLKMMGKIGMMKIFEEMKVKMEKKKRKRVEEREEIFEEIGIIIEILIGENIMRRWGIRKKELIIEEGVIMKLR